jgi:TonB family protein
VEPPALTPPAAAPTVVSDAPVNEVLPDVSRGALDTIRGTVRVSVRVSVASDGSVVDAAPEDPGPSRYFERRSIEAARKWSFAPTETAERRSMLVRFAFTRSGVTASTSPAK